MEIVHGSIYGYREWVLFYNHNTRLPELHPIVASIHKWPYSVVEARCFCKLHKDPNIVPEDKCRCGLYALKLDYRHFKTRLPRIFGRVELFGRVEYHEDGYRSQYARVDAIDPITLCNMCFVRGRHHHLRLDSEDTVIVFGTIGAARLPIGPIRRISQALCRQCADESSVVHGGIMEPPYSQMVYHSIARSKPLFDTLTRLYCDGRLMSTHQMEIANGTR